MAGMFEKNLKAMEKWYPSYAKLVRDRAEDGLEETINIKEETSWDGEQIFRIEKEGRKLYLNGKRNAKGTVSTWQERLGELHKYAPVLLLGLGSGLYLKKLCETADETVRVIVYEPSPEIFLHALNHVDLSGCMEKRMIAWIVEGINETELAAVLGKLISVENIEYFREEEHPNYRELFPEEMLKALKAAGRQTEDVIMGINTGIRFASVMVKNEFQNIRYVIDGYNVMGLAKAVNRDCPAVLVSAGPSLNKNIQELKRAKNRAFILAVDTALKPLLKEGIRPDAFITIDGKKPLTLVELDQVRDIPIIAPVTANCELLERQRNKRIFYCDGAPLPFMAYLEVGKAMPGAPSGGSVACSGFSVLYKMGFPTIILVGQDLAYRNGKSHADGTFRDVMPKVDTEGMIMVKGNYEEKVPTRPDFKKYLDWFNAYIAGAKEHRKDLRVINATEGGAKIEGTELMTLKDALDEACGKEEDFEAAIGAMESDFTEEEKEKVKGFLWDVSEEFTDIKKDAKKLQTAYKKVGQLSRSKNMDASAYAKQLKKIKKLNKSCEMRTAYELISASMPIAEYIIQSESLKEQDSIEEEAKVIAKQGMQYAGFIIQCAELLQEYMQESFADFSAFQRKGM